ncbi:neutral zinc metallopeptidase [Streptosporangium sp. NPDC006013]|uniref:neutral zinc metallopeptidase n=1 Tax=Streptosporangium sp. NPDC006013 TaxID=3155596 RepID=UPI0033AD70D4
MAASRWRITRLALVSLLTGVLIAGLTGTGTATATASGHAPLSASTARNLDDINQDIRSAQYVVNRFWATHWSEFFPGWYSPPRVLGGYDGARSNAPRCQGYPLPDDNALYCWPPYDFIAWDVDLMRMGYRQGDAWVYLIIAHEWGHAVQARIPRKLLSPRLELQADCLAGATLFGAAEDGILFFETGDTQEIAAALRQHADDTPWTDVSDHGSASQRLSAFNRGARQGVRGCFT